MRSTFHLKLWLGLALPVAALVWWVSFRYAHQNDASAASAKTEPIHGKAFSESRPATPSPSLTSQPTTRTSTQTAAKSSPRPASQPAVGSAGAAASPAAPAPVLPPPPPSDGTYESVPFDTLASFLYLQSLDGLPPPDVSGEDGDGPTINVIPATIAALDGHKIAVVGFMMPTAIREEGVQSFLLVRDPMLCCWGMKLAMMNEWVRVEMVPGKFASYEKHVPALVRGKLAVGEEYIDGIVTSIYRMTADSVELQGGF